MNKLFYVVWFQMLIGLVSFAISFEELSCANNQPEIFLAEAKKNAQDSIDLALGFYDPDLHDIWQAQWCLGNDQKPTICYEDSLSIVSPNITNNLSYKPATKGTWWIVVRDLHGLKAEQQLNITIVDNFLDDLVYSFYLANDGFYHVKMLIDEQNVPLNIKIINANGVYLYQRSFIKAGDKEIQFLSETNAGLILEINNNKEQKKHTIYLSNH
jgi:hypothetical protein